MLMISFWLFADLLFFPEVLLVALELRHPFFLSFVGTILELDIDLQSLIPST